MYYYVDLFQCTITLLMLFLCRPIIVIHYVHHLSIATYCNVFFVLVNKAIIVVIMNCLPCLQYFYSIKNMFFTVTSYIVVYIITHVTELHRTTDNY